MKLRIKGNSLRLRVSRSELAQFQAGSRIEETIRFTAAPEATFTYALESALRSSPVNVRYGSREVTVILSQDRARICGGKRTSGRYSTRHFCQSSCRSDLLKYTSVAHERTCRRAEASVGISTCFSTKQGYPRNNFVLIQLHPTFLLALTLALRVLS